MPEIFSAGIPIANPGRKEGTHLFDNLKKVAELVKKDREAAKKEQKDTELLPQSVVDNVNDLGDRFNRARYMDKDGE